MSIIKRAKRMLALFAVNHFLSGTHFFGAKRVLLRFAGVEIGPDSKVVGPLYLGGVASLKLGDHVWLGRNASIDGMAASRSATGSTWALACRSGRAVTRLPATGTAPARALSLIFLSDPVRG